MLFLSFKRILNFAWQHFWRNVWLSLVTITIIVLTLFSLTTLVLINAVGDKAIQTVQKTVDMSLYFSNEINESTVKLVQKKIEEIQGVKEVNYISPEQALQKFKTKHQNDKDIQAGLEELKDNPLGATLVIKAYRIEDYPLIMQKIKEMKIDQLAEKIDYDDYSALVRKINELSHKLRNLGLILSLVFIVIAILTVFNTIRMGIYIHRKEITIMRLVGASNWFIRLPFVIEGILYAVFSCLAFWGFMWLVLHFIGPWINSFLAGIDFNIQTYFAQNLPYILGFEFIVIVIINVVSAVIAMGRYLRV